MATLDDVVRTQVLEFYRLPTWEVRVPIRKLWIAGEFYNWFDRDEHHTAHVEDSGRTTGEHIDQLFRDLRCSRRPHAGELRRMRPNVDGVWKFHPAGCRLYGWCVGNGEFVVVCGATVDETKAENSNVNNEKRDYVKAFIEQHKLQSTVVLGDINAVFPPSS